MYNKTHVLDISIALDMSHIKGSEDVAMKILGVDSPDKIIQAYSKMIVEKIDNAIMGRADTVIEEAVVREANVNKATNWTPAPEDSEEELDVDNDKDNDDILSLYDKINEMLFSVSASLGTVKKVRLGDIGLTAANVVPDIDISNEDLLSIGELDDNRKIMIDYTDIHNNNKTMTGEI